jgi:hypothetical protein
MNKIIKNHYPVERLPSDLQAGLPKGGRVRIELEPELEGSDLRSIAGLVGTGRNVHGAPEAIVSHVRSLREER